MTATALQSQGDVETQPNPLLYPTQGIVTGGVVLTRLTHFTVPHSVVLVARGSCRWRQECGRVKLLPCAVR